MKARAKLSVLALALSVAGTIVFLTPGPAQAVVAAAAPGSYSAGYATPVVFTQDGGPVTFVNGDVAVHTVTASDAFLRRKVARKTRRCAPYPKKRCPLFATGSVGSGESKNVSGLKRLKPGKEYAFRCDFHSGMRGTLVVAP